MERLTTKLLIKCPVNLINNVKCTEAFLILLEYMLKKKGSRVEFSWMFAQEKAFRQQLSIPFDICVKLVIKFIVEIKLLQSTGH